MPFQKIWLGTVDTDPTDPLNWQAISVRTSAYAWTASGSGTTEFYLRTSGSANPGITSKPGVVLFDGVSITEGTAGSLAANRWAYGDNDSLGYSTLYVRLADGADPDSKTRDYVQFQAIPTAADDVTLSGSAVNAIAGVDWLSIAIADFFIESGFTNKAIGSRLTPLRIDPDTCISEGSGTQPWYIDLGSAAISPEIRNCPRPATGRGLYLTGSALATIIHDAGSLALAGLPGETSTVATYNARGCQAVYLLSEGVTLTTLRSFAGIGNVRCNASTVNVDGGGITTELAAAFTALNIRGGRVIEKSTGTHTAVVQDDGSYETMQMPAAKTLTAFKLNAGVFRENVDLLTITTRNEPDYAGVVERKRV
jgi:hypothetical protein